MIIYIWILDIALFILLLLLFEISWEIQINYQNYKTGIYVM